MVNLNNFTILHYCLITWFVVCQQLIAVLVIIIMLGLWSWHFRLFHAKKQTDPSGFIIFRRQNGSNGDVVIIATTTTLITFVAEIDLSRKQIIRTCV